MCVFVHTCVCVLETHGFGVKHILRTIAGLKSVKVSTRVVRPPSRVILL